MIKDVNIAVGNTCVSHDNENATDAHRQGTHHLHGRYVRSVLIFWTHLLLVYLGK